MKLPTFVHDFPSWWSHGGEYAENHSVKSGLHVEIDFILNYLQGKPKWKIRKSNILSLLFRGFISLVWGFNCHFPPRDIMRYVIWESKGYPLSSEFKEE